MINSAASTRLFSPLPPLDLLQRYSLEEASKYLRQSRAKTYQDIKEGRIEILKDGRRTYIPGTVIAARSCGQTDEVTE